jgi:hypothetical protein
VRIKFCLDKTHTHFSCDTVNTTGTCHFKADTGTCDHDLQQHATLTARTGDQSSVCMSVANTLNTVGLYSWSYGTLRHFALCDTSPWDRDNRHQVWVRLLRVWHISTKMLRNYMLLFIEDATRVPTYRLPTYHSRHVTVIHSIWWQHIFLRAPLRFFHVSV